MYRETGELILASGSPRRLELLKSCGLNFRVAVSGSDEIRLPGETPEEMVRRLSALKAEAVAAGAPQSWVLGADTTVVLGEAVMGKPADAAEAEEMLGRLQGRCHGVWGGFAIINQSRRVRHIEAHRTLVSFLPLSRSEIRAYVAGGEPLDKAGAYAVQGTGAAFIDRIEGSYTNVVGLPLSAVLLAMIRLGAVRCDSRPLSAAI